MPGGQSTPGRLQYAALTSLVGNCDARIVATVDLESNEILRSLSTELDALLADVSVAVPRLTGARTPSEVLAAGVKVSAVWNDELRPLRDKYDQLRDAQKFVEGSEISCHGSDYVWGDPHCSRLYIRNIDDIFAGWKSPDISRVNLSGVPSDPRPRPDHPVAQLVWFATNNAQLWIPTREDMRILERELHIRNNPQPAVIPGRPDKLRKKPIGTIY